jgi:hypothetical protein
MRYRNNCSGVDLSMLEFALNVIKWGAIYSIPIVIIITLSTKDNDIDRLLRNCGLKNADGKLPKLLSKDLRNYGYNLVFTLPSGVCLKDFENEQNKISSEIS